MAVIINIHYIMLAKTGKRNPFGSLNTGLGKLKINDVIYSDVRWIKRMNVGSRCKVQQTR